MLVGISVHGLAGEEPHVLQNSVYGAVPLSKESSQVLCSLLFRRTRLILKLRWALVPQKQTGPSASASDRHDMRRRKRARAPTTSESSNRPSAPSGPNSEVPLAVAGEHGREIASPRCEKFRRDMGSVYIMNWNSRLALEAAG